MITKNRLRVLRWIKPPSYIRRLGLLLVSVFIIIGGAVGFERSTAGNYACLQNYYMTYDVTEAGLLLHFLSVPSMVTMVLIQPDCAAP